MKLFLLYLLNFGHGKMNLPKKYQFQEYITTAAVQPALQFTENNPQAAEFEFDITSPSDGSAANTFELKSEKDGNELKGSLSIVSGVRLDRETLPQYLVTIRSVNGNGEKIEEKEVTISVADVNDNAPVIDQSSLMMEIHENAIVGDLVGTVKASDQDNGMFAKLEFKKASSGADTFYPRSGGSKGFDVAFKIDPSGEVYLIKQVTDLLNAEDYEKVTFDIEVRDDPDNPGAHSTTKGIVQVIIKDVNDHAPVFQVSDTTATISESAQIGDEIDITISAVDEDVAAENNYIEYRVVGDAPFKFIGDKLVVNGELDYEGKDQYILTIEAFNPRSAIGMSSETQLTIKISDKNEPPKCTGFTQSSTPLENQVDMESVGQMQCTDGDSGNQVLSYDMVDPAGFFGIDETGSIIVLTAPDREWSAKNPLNKLKDYVNNGLHTVTVTARDNGVPPLEKSMPISIGIGDTSDEPPMFSREDYLYICSDPQHLHLSPFALVDPDESGQIVATSALMAGFELEQVFGTTNMYQLNYDGSLNSFSGQLDTLELTATDDTGRETTKTFGIQICTCNDDGDKTQADDGTLACAVGVLPPNKGTFPWWIIILIVALLVGVILISTIVIVKRKGVQEKMNGHRDDEDDTQGLFSEDADGGEANDGKFDPNMPVLNGRQNTHNPWAKPRPDGDLGDIILQCKDAADQEEIVPNALLSFEFEGRNSIISDLSSLASWTGQSEKDLQLDDLPDAVQKNFRQHP